MQAQQANMSLQMRNITSDAAVAALEIERLRRRNLDLELECQVLKGATFSSIPVTACISCFAERAKTAICMDQICALETVVNGLKIQLENTATESLNSSQSPETTYTANASEMDESVWEDVKSAEQLYGPMEVDSFKITVKSLPSFKYRQDFVDEYFDLIEQEAKVATPREARQLLVKIVKANSKVRKVCSVMDRMKCLELTAIFHERNLKQEIHFSKLCEPSERSKQKVANRPLTNMPPQVERFNLTVKSIPSFKDSFDLVDQLCSFWVYECDSDDFFHMNYLLFQLEIISKDVEDRTKVIQFLYFFQALYIGLFISFTF
ncbi:hypothetical protein BDR26DRAFT_873326 [Obelidium mucronatum]|nr:hypothetical protein BDR26DRAFT_873326 [Obelidium mucronatum]